jgi:hypothetical protein
MSTVTHTRGPSFGRRTLPQALDDLASSHSDRLYASIPKDRDLSVGFIDVSCRDMARCVNFMAHWIASHLGVSTDFATLAYVGIPDLRSAAVFLGAVKCGYKVRWPSSFNSGSYMLILTRYCCLRLAILRRQTCPSCARPTV